MVGQGFKADVGIALQQLADGAGRFFVVIEAGDDRGTNLHVKVGEVLEKLLEIGKDEFVAHASGPLMLFGVSVLDVEEHVVEQGGSFFEAFPFVATAGFDGRLDAASAGFTQEGESEVLLEEGLTAGNGHAAAGAGVENGVLGNGVEHVFNSALLAVGNDTAGRAGLGAGESLTFGAVGAVDVEGVTFSLDGLVGAGGDAVVALVSTDATGGVEGHLRLEQLRFRVTAPAARKGATLGENDGADARAVVHRIFLDIEHDAGDFSVLESTHTELTERLLRAERQ